MIYFESRCLLTERDGSYEVQVGQTFSNGLVERPIEVICDVDEFGELTGIEALDFKATTSVAQLLVPAPSIETGEPCRISYSEASDALYFELRQTRPRDQRATSAMAIFDSLMAFRGFRVTA